MRLGENEIVIGSLILQFDILHSFFLLNLEKVKRSVEGIKQQMEIVQKIIKLLHSTMSVLNCLGHDRF